MRPRRETNVIPRRYHEGNSPKSRAWARSWLLVAPCLPFYLPAIFRRASGGERREEGMAMGAERQNSFPGAEQLSSFPVCLARLALREKQPVAASYTWSSASRRSAVRRTHDWLLPGSASYGGAPRTKDFRCSEEGARDFRVKDLCCFSCWLASACTSGVFACANRRASIERLVFNRSATANPLL